MAGQPKKREGLKAITAAGGQSSILARVAEGMTLKALAVEVGVSRQFLSTWCNADTRRDAYARARREAALSHAEDGLRIVDGATPETAQVAKLQSDFRRWMATRMDPSAWAETKSAQVNIDLGRLHLEAVKEINQQARVAREEARLEDGKIRRADEDTG
jgi:transcriptional regulator with XRE-family HTH domain